MNDTFVNQCKYILDPLIKKGWFFLNFDNKQIIMRKQFCELDEIKIIPNGHYIEFVMPIKNSSYSFFKKIHNHDTIHSYDNIQFLKNYISYI